MTKKALAVLAALMILLLPLGALAENAGAEADGRVYTSEPAGIADASVEETPAAAEDAAPAKGDQPLSFGESLGYMLKGMAGIFLVTGIIILAVVILEKTGGKKKDGQA